MVTLIVQLVFSKCGKPSTPMPIEFTLLRIYMGEGCIHIASIRIFISSVKSTGRSTVHGPVVNGDDAFSA